MEASTTTAWKLFETFSTLYVARFVFLVCAQLVAYSFKRMKNVLVIWCVIHLHQWRSLNQMRSDRARCLLWVTSKFPHVCNFCGYKRWPLIFRSNSDVELKIRVMQWFTEPWYVWTDKQHTYKLQTSLLLKCVFVFIASCIVYTSWAMCEKSVLFTNVWIISYTNRYLLKTNKQTKS